MYPDIYHMVYPRIQQVCAEMDVPGNPDMYPYPSRAAVERMTEDIYRQIEADMEYCGDNDRTGEGDRQIAPYYGAGPYLGGYYGAPFYGYGYPAFSGYGGRRFLRDLVGILLIRQLLGRRGFFY
jgi:hypothetical protein